MLFKYAACIDIRHWYIASFEWIFRHVIVVNSNADSNPRIVLQADANNSIPFNIQYDQHRLLSLSFKSIALRNQFNGRDFR